MARCFYMVNQEWFLKRFEVPEHEWEVAWDLLYDSLQIGFNGNHTDAGWLTMHALLGAPTAEGMHPRFIDDWISMSSLLEYMGCAESVSKWQKQESIEECLADDEDASISTKMRLACGTAGEPVRDVTSGSTMYPMNAGILRDCPAHYIGNDAVYFNMAGFKHADRVKIIDGVNTGPDKWEHKEWEATEKADGSFIGAIEQRSKPVERVSWQDGQAAEDDENDGSN